ncbi:MAG: type II secretion system F family protein [Burkholderiaceae bacterium]
MSARNVQAAKAALFQQLANAARNGLPLAEVVRVLVEDDQWTRGARAGLQRVATRLEAGDALSAALAVEPKLFATATADLVRHAEALPPVAFADVLATLSADARRLAAARRAVAATLAWPMTLGAVLLVELAACAIAIRPTMQDAFEAMHAPSPLPAPAGLLLDGGWLALLPVYVVLLLWSLGWLPRAARGSLEAVAETLPFVARWRSVNAAARLLAWLPACQSQPGLRPAVAAHLGATDPSARASAAARRLSGAFGQGQALVEALDTARALPARMLLLARLGERSASLPDVIADLRDDAVGDEALAFARFERGCIALSYALIGVLVALLLVGIYLPIFKIGTLL